MRYLFGDCELNTQTCELRRAGIPVLLTPKAYAVRITSSLTVIGSSPKKNCWSKYGPIPTSTTPP
jgi:hypothetical protein